MPKPAFFSAEVVGGLRNVNEEMLAMFLYILSVIKWYVVGICCLGYVT